MKYYKDENDQIYAYESNGSQDAYITNNLIAITQKEADKIRNPSLTTEQIQEQINQKHRNYLNSTDWYVVRFVETGVSIPNDILLARQNARNSILQ